MSPAEEQAFVIEIPFPLSIFVTIWKRQLYLFHMYTVYWFAC